MEYNSRQETSYLHGLSNYARSHWVSLGLFLSGYGALYLLSVILNRQITNDWEKAVAIYSPASVSPLLHRGLFDPLFFVTSLPALIIGLTMLSSYSLRGIGPAAAKGKQYVAILLTVLGFTYQVVGAWPLQHQADFPWQWQKQIVSLGPIFSWTMYILSLTILLIGVVCLYKLSLIYHQRSFEDQEEW